MASIGALKLEAIKRRLENGGSRSRRHNLKGDYELIRRSESGDRSRDELRPVDRWRHGAGVMKAESAATIARLVRN
jgi:hypothetical protein